MGERERRPSLDLSLRRRSLERERSRRLCLSFERSRFFSLSVSLSRETSRRLSFERSFILSPDLSRLFSRDLSRRLSFDRSLFRSLDPSRFLSLDESRGFLYGSGDVSRWRTGPGSTGASFASRSLGRSLGLLSLDLLLDRRAGGIEGSFPARTEAFLENLSGLPVRPAAVSAVGAHCKATDLSPCWGRVLGKIARRVSRLGAR
jgi:hypothetical protein